MPETLRSNSNDHLEALRQITEAAQKKATNKQQSQPVTSKAATTPSHIIDWPPALRHVSRLAAQDPDLERSICRLITDQWAHEETWWEQRESLRKAIELGQAPKSELSNYDGKIYTAQVDMNEHMSIELRNLGIPFFGMPSSLIVDGDAAPAGKLSSKQLRDLQFKMLDYLQVMFGPD